MQPPNVERHSNTPHLPRLIAEIGNNHLGDVERAREMLAEVLAAGVDAVTFQVREPRFYQKAEMAHLKLSGDFFEEAASLVHGAGRHFGVAICDASLVPVLDTLGVDFWKTLSWDFRNEELRTALHRTRKPVFYSTGVSAMDDIVEGSRGLRNAVLIHTQLSDKLCDVNLKAIRSMERETALPVAFGLHCNNHEVLNLALAFEPHALFFYVKVSGIPAYDDGHAIALDRLAGTVNNLKELMPAVGTGIKLSMDTPAWVQASK